MKRWELQAGRGIVWRVTDGSLPHEDHVEMSGERASMIVRYGADRDASPFLRITMVYPMLRTIPNDTHGSAQWEYSPRPPLLRLADGTLRERLTEVRFDGILRVCGRAGPAAVCRELCPSPSRMGGVMKTTVRNEGAEPVYIRENAPEAPATRKGAHGILCFEERKTLSGKTRTLRPGQETAWYTVWTGRRIDRPSPRLPGARALAERRAFVDGLDGRLVLQTPDRLINEAFAFAKLRAAESVFYTEGGWMHCPGGMGFYAAIWANDEAEYAGPFFPYLGCGHGVEAAKQCLRLYARYMGPQFEPVPSSIISQAQDIWEGAGDRGDAAMIGYGGAKLALTLGDEAFAREIYPAVRWCMAYCRRKRTPEGVIASDSDELEGRFPTGDANLSTSCMTLGGLRYAAKLARFLGYERDAGEYEEWIPGLERAIDGYFGCTLHGFETYRYFEGCRLLRSWICLPLVMGVPGRSGGTVDALLSDYLWTGNGLLTQEGRETYWDRATAYAFRGIFMAGETERAMPFFKDFLTERTLGSHVPYLVEEGPGGSRWQLSAESALLCLGILEGLLGIRTEGMKTFSFRPRLPEDWDDVRLTHIRLGGMDVNLRFSRGADGVWITEITDAAGRVIERLKPGECWRAGE